MIPFPKPRNIVIENIRPLVNNGEFALKREPMDWVLVQADVFRHSYEKFEIHIRYRKKGTKNWNTTPMAFVDNDTWEGQFQVKSVGFYEYQIMGQTIEPKDLNPTLTDCFEVRVDPIYARFSSWYEMFPRSQGTNPKKAATWDDCIARLPDIKEMGFDTLYLVPIHPIGKTNRKGANNSLKAKKGEPGCPYAIGNEHGGHFAVDPDIGTMEDFERFMAATKQFGFRMALDIALNCSPDHPHVQEHDEWFYHEPDGSIKYAENPPKKYEDVYPYDYWNKNWQELWTEVRDTILFWGSKGFDIFRIDNPHTKPFLFWEWIIRDVKEQHPEYVFLAEAFTRPKLMQRLGKQGFDLSYTYFTWRNEKWELEEYLKELTSDPIKQFMRGIFFPTTPDIFPKILWNAPPAAFAIRAFLAATLLPAWGMYNGYELCENENNPKKEELYHSEKYQYKTHEWNKPGNIKEFIGKVNLARRTCPAFQEYDNLQFHFANNDQIMVYSKRLEDPRTCVLCIVSLDAYNSQGATVHLQLDALSLSDNERFVVKDLISGESYMWKGSANYVELNPNRVAHIFVIGRIS
jgi:starch synthase (maltosyl-transferring)